MIRRNRGLLLLHAAANALLLWLAYEWLGVDESTTAKLFLSAADALAILTLICWLDGATLVWFRSGEEKLNDTFRISLRHVGWLLALAVAALAVYGLLEKSAAASGGPALKIASWLTWTLRTPVKPAAINAIFQGAFWLLRWAVLPILLLPAASAIAAQGRPAWRARRQYAAIPLLALIGLWLPFLILDWKPKAPSFALELASFALRAAFAYALFIAAMLGLARTAGLPARNMVQAPPTSAARS